MIDDIFLEAMRSVLAFIYKGRGIYCVVVFVYGTGMGLNCVSCVCSAF